MQFWRILREIVQVGLLRGCPACQAKPGRHHAHGCVIAAWDRWA